MMETITLGALRISSNSPGWSLKEWEEKIQEMWEVREQEEDQRGTSRCPLEGDNGGKDVMGRSKEILYHLLNTTHSGSPIIRLFSSKQRSIPRHPSGR